MQVNQASRLLSLKIVYCGPGLSGKTTNLVKLHRTYPEHQRGDLIQLDTERERGLFFDFFPLAMGKIGGYRTRIDFFSVPGHSFLHTTRRSVLEGVDGLVFVADSRSDRGEANHLAKVDLVQHLTAMGRPLATIPHVYQWNKRDEPRALAVDVLERTLNPDGARSFTATAKDGAGVWETQGTIIRAVFHHVAEQSRKRWEQLCATGRGDDLATASQQGGAPTQSKPALG